MTEYRPTIDCQGCGDILNYLTDAQAQRVANNPQNFIFWCQDCIKNETHIDPSFQ